MNTLLFIRFVLYLHFIRFSTGVSNFRSNQMTESRLSYFCFRLAQVMQILDIPFHGKPTSIFKRLPEPSGKINGIS